MSDTSYRMMFHLHAGHGALYATRDIKAGEIICEFGPKVVVNEPNYLTVQVGDTQHIMLSPEWLQYINHSCEPVSKLADAGLVHGALGAIASDGASMHAVCFQI